jgi:hypothetical protein
MGAPQYELSISKIEEAIVHFLVVEDHKMVGQLCEIWLECKGAKSNHIGNPHLGKNPKIPHDYDLIGFNTELNGNPPIPHGVR